MIAAKKKTAAKQMATIVGSDIWGHLLDVRLCFYYTLVSLFCTYVPVSTNVQKSVDVLCFFLYNEKNAYV